MFSFIVTFLAEKFVEFIADKIVDLLPVFGDETKYILYHKYNIGENEKKYKKSYKSETIVIDKENLFREF